MVVIMKLYASAFAMFLAIGLLPDGGLKSCATKRAAPVVVRDSCPVIRELLYNNGRFKFTQAEQDALSEENLNKLVATKDWYAEHCLGRKPA